MKILVAFDGSPSSRAALDKTVELFSASDPEIVLVRAFVRPVRSGLAVEPTEDDLCEEMIEELDEALKVVGEAGLQGRTLLVDGPPREVLEETCTDEEPDLLVVGARGHSTVAKVLLGSVSSYAIKHLAVPVMVVRRS